MDLSFNEDQTTFLTFLDQLLATPDAAFRAAQGWQRYDYGAALDARLDEAGFFDVTSEETLGPVMAAEMIHRVAQAPVVVECAASALLRPMIAPDLPRPVAVIDGDAQAAIRFLPVARSVILLDGDGIRHALLPDGIPLADSLFAYPMGRLETETLDWQAADCDPGHAADLWRIALATELSGVLQGGLQSVLAHVRDRQQFGRPLGSFQGVQHRLAEAAVRLDGARWLALRAAQTGAPADAALALAHAQHMARRIVYDLHQFMGAMGLTLEHPLHRWTYRARLLASAIGGPSRALSDYADRRWGAA